MRHVSQSPCVRLWPLLALFAAACSSGSDGGGLTLSPDADGDGLPDFLERELGSDPGDGDDPFAGGAEDADDTFGPGPDALPDGLERYLVEGGASVPVTARSDTDGDGIPDYLELAGRLDWRDFTDPLENGGMDFENPGGPALDGISDSLEAYLIRRGARAPITVTSDADGDGFEDYLEARTGTDPFDPRDPQLGRAFDLDGDGLPDYLELLALDSGGDPLDADFPIFQGALDVADDTGPPGDGISDGLELFLVRDGAEAPVTPHTDSDGDGVPTTSKSNQARIPSIPTNRS